MFLPVASWYQLEAEVQHALATCITHLVFAMRMQHLVNPLGLLTLGT